MTPWSSRYQKGLLGEGTEQQEMFTQLSRWRPTHKQDCVRHDQCGNGPTHTMYGGMTTHTLFCLLSFLSLLVVHLRISHFVFRLLCCINHTRLLEYIYDFRVLTYGTSHTAVITKYFLVVIFFSPTDIHSLHSRVPVQQASCKPVITAVFAFESSECFSW